MTPETKPVNSQSVTVTEQVNSEPNKRKKEKRRRKRTHAFATSVSQTILQKGKNMT